MKIPESVRINGVDFSVELIAHLNDGVHKLHGLANFCTCSIAIDPDSQEHQMKCITLWHEILHVILHNAQIDLPEDEEERIVTALSNGVYQVLQDNGRKLFDIADPIKNEAEDKNNEA